MNPMHSYSTVSHYTPSFIVEAARWTLGGFIALDPASNEFANKLVQAHEYFDSNGLDEPWWGPLFLNPPGKCPSNPGGASDWWYKLVREWQEDLVTWKPWSAIFVGFSLELLQVCQKFPCLQPLDFATCIPKKRLRFDRDIRDVLHETLKEAEETPNIERRKALLKSAATLRGHIEAGRLRLPGNSPTHSNIIVCLSHCKEVSDRFMEAFHEIGHVRR